MTTMTKSNNRNLKKFVQTLRVSLQSLNPSKNNEPQNATKDSQPHYPKFAYLAGELSAFTLSMDTFIILLKEGTVIKYKPGNAPGFYKWLVDNNVRCLDDTDSDD